MKVAVVDDHALFRKGMISMLQDIPGTEVTFQAGNGQELLDQLSEHPVDLVLLDLQMPVMDGLTAIPLVKGLSPETKIIIISMHQEDQFISHVMELGANGYLLKDAEFDELEIALASVKDSGFYFNENVSKALLSRLVHKKQLQPSFVTEEVLGDREKEVLELICKELTTAEIAEKIHLSPRTIEGYRNRLLEKTNARNTAGLVVYAAKKGWLDGWLA